MEGRVVIVTGVGQWLGRAILIGLLATLGPAGQDMYIPSIPSNAGVLTMHSGNLAR